MAKKLTAGQCMIACARQALAFAQGKNHAGVVHIPDEIDTARIRRKINSSLVIRHDSLERKFLTQGRVHSQNCTDGGYALRATGCQRGRAGGLPS